jgi:hypothetical protein
MAVEQKNMNFEVVESYSGFMKPKLYAMRKACLLYINCSVDILPLFQQVYSGKKIHDKDIDYKDKYFGEQCCTWI